MPLALMRLFSYKSLSLSTRQTPHGKRETRPASDCAQPRGVVTTHSGSTMSARRPQIHGRSIVLGSEKLHVRGVAYGTFRSLDGYSLPPPDRVRADFEAMAAAGANALRTYEPPPLWLLEMAAEHGLTVMVGLAWEQHIAFLDEPGRAKAIEAKVVEQVRACEAHPAILAYALGNEIPAPIARWHGKGAI